MFINTYTYIVSVLDIRLRVFQTDFHDKPLKNQISLLSALLL